uniref:hypothetical protein n=1 Tax=Escherichia coli TaxID=562 RepID=UPI0005C57692
PFIRAFSNEKHEEERFDKVNKNLAKTKLFAKSVVGSVMQRTMLISTLQTCIFGSRLLKCVCYDNRLRSSI